MKAHSFIRRSALETQELMGIVEMNREQIKEYKSAPKYIVTAFNSRVTDKASKDAIKFL